MIAILKQISWRAMWQAMKGSAALFGVAALVAWFAVGWPWYALLGWAAVVVAVMACCYQIALVFERHSDRGRTRRELARLDDNLARGRMRRLQRRRGDQSWLATLDMPEVGPIYRKRFVRFNPDTGDEEFKNELVS